LTESREPVISFLGRVAAIRDPLLRPRYRSAAVLRGMLKALLVSLLCAGGGAAPLVAGSDAEALAHLRHTPGACSYVSDTNTGELLVVVRL
jgi:hypothetical protein